MVEQGTRAWLKITDSDLFAQPLPKDVVASAFANRQLYLVLANYTTTPIRVKTSDAYRSAADPSVGPKTVRNLEGHFLQIKSF